MDPEEVAEGSFCGKRRLLLRSAVMRREMRAGVR
jgi:hypothetical protein